MEQKHHRILSCYYTHKPGGFCLRLYRLLNGSIAAGDEVHYVTLDAPPAQLSTHVVIHQIPFFLKMRSGALFWVFLTLWLPVYLLIVARKVRPSRIVVFGAYYAAISSLAARCTQTPLILFIRSLVFEINRITEKPLVLRKLSSLLEWIGMRLASQVVCMSNSMATSVRSFSGINREIKILPNDLPARRDLTGATPELHEILADLRHKGQLVCLVAGVLDKRKNVSVVLEAIQKLQAYPLSSQLVLVVAGEGPLRNELQNKSSHIRKTKILFPGWISDLNQIFDQIDLLLHPSFHEGISNTVLEAWSNGTPTLLSDTPEMRELSGGAVPCIDPFSPEEWAVALKDILTSRNRLNDLRVSTLTRAEQYRFDWEDAARALF